MEINKTYPFLTSLRGYAALMVFLIHGGTFLRDQNFILQGLVDYGKFGVEVFFIISAVTLSLSIHNTKKFNFFHYLKRRFWRIAPVYFLVCIICFAFAGSISGGVYERTLFHIQPYDLQDLFYHFTFLSLFNQQYQDTLVGVEWTIPLEFFYYLLIPVFYFLAKKSRWFLTIPVVLGIYLYFHQNIFLPIYITRFGSGDWSIEKFLSIYAMGVLGFFCIFIFSKRKEKKLFKRIYPYLLSTVFLAFLLFYLNNHMSPNEIKMIIFGLFIAIYAIYFKSKLYNSVNKKLVKKIIENIDITLLLFLFLLYTQFQYNKAPELITGFFSIVLIAILIQGGTLHRIIFENRIAMHIGKISYSFYLFHIIIITLFLKLNIQNLYINFALIFIVTLILSTISQKYIEQYFLNKYAKSKR